MLLLLGAEPCTAVAATAAAMWAGGGEGVAQLLQLLLVARQLLGCRLKQRLHHTCIQLGPCRTQQQQHGQAMCLDHM
jgi:hypothetical protein